MTKKVLGQVACVNLEEKTLGFFPLHRGDDPSTHLRKMFLPKGGIEAKKYIIIGCEEGIVNITGKIDDLPENTKKWVNKMAEIYYRIVKPITFVEHIEKHLKEMKIDGKVMCKICEKDIDKIFEER